MTIDKQLLLVRPNLKLDESLEGYSYRLGIENGYGFREASQFQSFLTRHAVKERVYSPLPLYKVLSDITGKDEEKLYERESYRIPYDLVLQARYRREYVRFCPICLEEEQYHRIDWFIKPIYFCLRHKTMLEYECRHCQSSTTMRDVVYATCANCAGSLKSKYASPVDFCISSFFHHDTLLFDSSPFYANLPKMDFWGLLYKLGFSLMILYGEKYELTYSYKELDEFQYRLFYRENNGLYIDLVRLCISIFSDWPKNLMELLQEEKNVRSYRKAADFFQRIFSDKMPESVIHWFKKTSVMSFIDQLEALKHALQMLPGNTSLEDLEQYQEIVSYEEALNYLGSYKDLLGNYRYGLREIKNLSKEPHYFKKEIEDLKNFLDGTVSTYLAGKFLGLKFKEMENLIMELGIIEVQKGQNYAITVSDFHKVCDYLKIHPPENTVDMH